MMLIPSIELNPIGLLGLLLIEERLKLFLTTAQTRPRPKRLKILAFYFLSY